MSADNDTDDTPMSADNDADDTPMNADKHPQMIRIQGPNNTDTPPQMLRFPLTAAFDDDDSGVIY